jgi:hypothetical protein
MKKEIPIAFSESMMNALLADNKSITRRILNPQPPAYVEYFEYYKGLFRAYSRGEPLAAAKGFADGSGYCRLNPKYNPGDILWIRESWGISGYVCKSEFDAGILNVDITYRADSSRKNRIKIEDPDLFERIIRREERHRNNIFYWGEMDWRLPMFMPRCCSRLNLLIVGVTVERVQEITESDARLEGFESRAAFIEYWNKLNKKRGFSFDKNPWVYRIHFKRENK